MRMTRVLGVLVAVLALAVVASSAQAAGKGKKAKKEHHLHGVVTKVEKDKDKDSGAITVKFGGRHHKNKKAAATAAVEKPTVEKAPVEKTFKVTTETKFYKVSGKKGAEKVEPASFADVKDGEHVSIETLGDVVQEVKIHEHHHHKKEKKA